METDPRHAPAKSDHVMMQAQGCDDRESCTAWDELMDVCILFTRRCTHGDVHLMTLHILHSSVFDQARLIQLPFSSLSSDESTSPSAFWDFLPISLHFCLESHSSGF